MVDHAWIEHTKAKRTFNRVSSQDNLINFKKKATTFQRLEKLETQKKIKEFPEEVGPFTISKQL